MSIFLSSSWETKGFLDPFCSPGISWPARSTPLCSCCHAVKLLLLQLQTRVRSFLKYLSNTSHTSSWSRHWRNSRRKQQQQQKKPREKTHTPALMELPLEWRETDDKLAKSGGNCCGGSINREKTDWEFLLAVIASVERGGSQRGVTHWVGIRGQDRGHPWTVCFGGPVRRMRIRHIQ